MISFTNRERRVIASEINVTMRSSVKERRKSTGGAGAEDPLVERGAEDPLVERAQTIH